MKRANLPDFGRRPPLVLLGAVALLLILALSGAIVHLVTESWWFAATGYDNVFWTRLRWQILIWVLALLSYGAFLYVNYRLALWLTRESSWRMLEQYNLDALADYLPRYLAIAFVVLVSFNAATGSAAAWDNILQFFNFTPFNDVDPLFQQDISFYVFRLPIYEGLLSAIVDLLISTLVLVSGIYLLKGEIRPERGWKYFLTGNVKGHLCILLAAMAIAVSVGFFFRRYDLLFSPDGVVFGAGYTDVHARLHAQWTMAFVTLAIAVLFILSLWRSGFVWPTVGISLYLLVFILVGGVYPWFQQRFLVEPNELAREKPYIEHSIAFTNEAYDLDQVRSEPFPAEEALDRESLSNNASTVDNIRLWDYRPLLSTYRQLQEIRLYYRFKDVDVDRYVLNDDYRQVMLSARELDYTEAPPEAQTWVNQRLKFTHGYGIVMSPVNRVTPEGLPELMIQNVPPVYTVDLEIEQPRIYYGEATDSYVFTGTTTDEFDYPQGDTNAPYRYDGTGGVPLSSFLRRLAYAYDMGSLKVLISNYITEESRVHYHRTVLERARQIAPFLTYDSDPYIAVIDGRLKWIIDAYTASDRYPYSQPLIRSNDIGALQSNNTINDLAQGGNNYVRDAAKVVIDAYDGTLNYYVVDEADPILATYRKIFPDLFQPANETPDMVRQHFRYPHDLFTLQAHMYRTYHMGDPEVFYNREDVWRFPTQVYEEDQIRMEPYYLIMRLPDAEREEFMLILPFTPINKDNMVSWMAGRSDGDNYGRLQLYEFPKQQLVYGPSQIEARIDQTPEISQQLTLWSQQGSRVIRGDLLVIPIEQSLLYVEPVYLRAEQGELPELRRVIVAYDNDVVMQETLEEGLSAIFGDRPSPSEAAVTPASDTVSAEVPNLSADQASRIQEALNAYEAGQQALQDGNWEAYGAAQQELESILNQLSEEL
ncbi:UPF0182 family protein [Oscillatoria sp. CS-180]|uniref:UPF0182 family membrane protein n=1 Tax=Oscillatoria sp. CS-180 TaxID=3021720 RepID=UPI00232DB617|nr:UPF0182 family protein [Oscillatoria sp. CS-180]MDB9528633.1 UPF0182 family protein [Oscillatoria sp. CS-180]